VNDTCTIALSTTTIRTSSRHGVSVVEVGGDVDLVAGGPIFAILDAEVARCQDGIVVDLTDATFFGSTGISVLLDAATRARDRGVGLVVAAGHLTVLRPLGITGVVELLTIRPTVDLAVAALRPGRTATR
jgi:anti-sigma B factor antagonist